MPDILPHLTARVHPVLHHLIAEDAAPSELGLHLVDLWGLATDIEEALGIEIPGDVVERWERVADVARDVGVLVGVEAV